MKPGMIIGAIVVFGGVIVGAGAMGVVQIPGISPKKTQAKKAVAKAEPSGEEKAPDPKPAAAESVQEPIVAAATEPATKEAELPTEVLEPERGAKRLARLWNEVETARLATVVASWKDEDLAPVLLKMDNAKVAELLTMLEPERASSLSRLVREVSSKVAVVPQG